MAASETIQNSDSIAVPPEIRDVLAGLRWRIRGYVWLQGLALAATWIGVTFWAALAIDYLPILVGADEMPRLRAPYCWRQSPPSRCGFFIGGYFDGRSCRWLIAAWRFCSSAAIASFTIA